MCSNAYCLCRRRFCKDVGRAFAFRNVDMPCEDFDALLAMLNLNADLSDT